MVAAKKNQKDSKGREGLARRASGLLSKPVTAVTTSARCWPSFRLPTPSRGIAPACRWAIRRA